MTQRDILKQTYTDTCDIYGIMQGVNEDGSTSQQRVKVYENQLCALSAKSIKDIKVTDSSNDVNQSYILFVDDTLTLHPGYMIHCRNLKFKAGLAMVYEGSHMEIPLLLEEKA